MQIGPVLARVFGRLAGALATAAIAAASQAALAAEGEIEKLPANIRDVTPPQMSRMPAIEDGLVKRTAPKLVPQPVVKPKPLAWPRAEVLAAGRLRSNTVEIVIAGIEPLPSEAICGSGENAWPCGNFARAAFARLVRRRGIACEPGELAEGRLVVRCAIDGRDLGEWLVRQGWAVPVDDDLYQEALAAARASQAGQWRAAAPSAGED